MRCSNALRQVAELFPSAVDGKNGRVMSRRFPLFAVLPLAILIAAELPAQAPSTLRLTTVATYGWSDMSESPKPLSTADRRLFAGELGSTNGALEGRNAEVFILDGVNKKVAVFDKDGGFLRAFGGEGEGPGEFRQPIRMTSGPDGSVFVWDRGLKRISHFGADGRAISQRLLPLVPNVTDFTIVGGLAWFVRLVLGRGHAVLAFDLTSGLAVDSFAPLTAIEAGISGYGAPGYIGRNTRGEVIYGGPFPVQLRIRSNGTTRSAGVNRFPDARGVISDQGVRNTPVSMRGMAVRPDGSIAVVYSTSDISKERISAPLTYWLELLAPDGTSRGRVELVDVERVGGISAAANGDLLLSVAVEYPQVLRVRVGSSP